MAADPSLADEARRRVLENRATPARAVWDAAELVAEQLRALGGMFADRAADVQDVRDRIIARAARACGRRASRTPGIPFVLVARDLAPADTARLDPAHVLAIVTSGGGPTAHTAILARALGIPCVVAVAGADAIADGETVLVDGSAGEVVRGPDADAVERAGRVGPRRTRLEQPGRTADGHAVPLLANVADPAGAAAAAEAGAEGIGLFRTEFEFLGRTTAPGIPEQVAAYAQVFAAFPGRRVVIRTLDAGADKPLPFVTAAGEPNPALGVRGLRTSWAHPGVLDDQLAAIAQAAASSSADVWVMAPMVATADEADAFVERCAAHGLAHAGVMVEVPAAALRAGDLLLHARFASLGTNDLTQYAMAADRELASLARLSTPWQPAVLSLVAAGVRGRRGARPARRGLRRGGRRPGARPRAGRARRRVAVDDTPGAAGRGRGAGGRDARAVPRAGRPRPGAAHGRRGAVGGARVAGRARGAGSLGGLEQELLERVDRGDRVGAVVVRGQHDLVAHPDAQRHDREDRGGGHRGRRRPARS